MFLCPLMRTLVLRRPLSVLLGHNFDSLRDPTVSRSAPGRARTRAAITNGWRKADGGVTASSSFVL